MDTYVKTSISEQSYEVQITEKKILGNGYEPKVALENKVYPQMYYKHQLRSVIMDETPAKIKAQGL